MEQAKIERINALAKKAKAEGLTEDERAEQQALRAAYIAEWKASLQSQLDNAVILNPDGTTEKLRRKGREGQ